MAKNNKNVLNGKEFLGGLFGDNSAGSESTIFMKNTIFMNLLYL